MRLRCGFASAKNVGTFIDLALIVYPQYSNRYTEQLHTYRNLIWSTIAFSWIRPTNVILLTISEDSTSRPKT
jgi:hypothetical protein